MRTVATIGEGDLIRRLQEQVATGPGVLAGIGDDAAVYDLGAGKALLVTVDTMVAGGHFLPERMPMRLVGRKAMASSVSDIAAMNGQPQCAVVALSTPDDTSIAAVDALYQGLEERARDYGLAIVGGDTTRSDVLTISVTVIGEARLQDVVYRSGASPGDLLCVTGTLGASQAGLQWMLSGAARRRPAAEAALRAHFDPAARLDVIRDWQSRKFRPRALTDISDGLAREIYHLCDASNCGAIVTAEAVPVSEVAREVAPLLEEDALDYALFWGEDYELVFALPREARARLDPATFTAIGEFTPHAGAVNIRRNAGGVSRLPRRGWEHFQPP